MKRLGVVLAFVCAIAPAYGVQEVTLKDLPPLQPLKWCKHSDGQVIPQNEPCGSDTTEVSSWTKRQPDGTMAHLTLQEAQAMDAANNPAATASTAKDAPNADVQKAQLGDFWKHMGKWVGFAIVVGLVAKFLKQSFLLWLILGFVLRALLVALNVMAF
jgi:hypothetical protein